MAFGISGFLVQVLTAPIAIAVDARQLPRVGAPARHDPARGGAAAAARGPRAGPREIREGLRLVRHDPVLRAFAGAQMALVRAVGHLRRDVVPVRARRAGLGPAVARRRRRGRWRSRRSSARSSRRGRRGAGASGRWRSRRCCWRRSATRSSRSRRPGCRSSPIGCLVDAAARRRLGGDRLRHHRGRRSARRSSATGRSGGSRRRSTSRRSSPSWSRRSAPGSWPR